MCQEENEAIVHILKCQSKGMQDLRKELLSELQTWLISKDPNISVFLCNGLYSWFQSTYYEPDQNADASNNLAFRAHV